MQFVCHFVWLCKKCKDWILIVKMIQLNLINWICLAFVTLEGFVATGRRAQWKKRMTNVMRVSGMFFLFLKKNVPHIKYCILPGMICCLFSLAFHKRVTTSPLRIFGNPVWNLASSTLTWVVCELFQVIQTNRNMGPRYQYLSNDVKRHTFQFLWILNAVICKSADHFNLHACCTWISCWSNMRSHSRLTTLARPCLKARQWGLICLFSL